MPEVVVFDNKFVILICPCGACGARDTREGAYILKDMRKAGLKQAFAYVGSELDGDRFREIDQIGGRQR